MVSDITKSIFFYSSLAKLGLLLFSQLVLIQLKYKHWVFNIILIYNLKLLKQCTNNGAGNSKIATKALLSYLIFRINQQKERWAGSSFEVPLHWLKNSITLKMVGQQRTKNLCSIHNFLKSWPWGEQPYCLQRLIFANMADAKWIKKFTTNLVGVYDNQATIITDNIFKPSSMVLQKYKNCIMDTILTSVCV